MDEEKKKQIIIEIDPELDEILMKLKEKIKTTTWDGLDNIGYKSLTRILARKIKASKIV